jgi:chromosome segregation ATPase
LDRRAILRWKKVASVSKDPLELWGEALLEMARLTKTSRAFFELFEDGFVKKGPEPQPAYQQFMDLSQRMFGKEGVEAFNTIMKQFYENVGVVPRTQYNELRDKYLQLKAKAEKLENEAEELKETLEGGKQPPDDLMAQWTRTMETYTEINQQFFKELGKFFGQ